MDESFCLKIHTLCGTHTDVFLKIYHAVAYCLLCQGLGYVSVGPY